MGGGGTIVESGCPGPLGPAARDTGAEDAEDTAPPHTRQGVFTPPCTPPLPAPYGAWVWAGGPQNTSDTYSGTAVKLMVIYPRLCVGGKNLCLPPTLPLFNLGFCTGQLID